MNKYRLVKKTNNAFKVPYVTYEIEKFKSFCFGSGGVPNI